MKRINSFINSILVTLVAAMALSCGGGSGMVQPETSSGNNEQITAEHAFEGIPSVSDLEEQFANEQSDDDKGMSWISHPNHLTPALAHLSAVDPADANCLLLKGIGDNVIGVPKGPHFAYALYQIPLGALETDLLSVKVTAQIGDPSNKYYAAIANFSASNWDFEGPLTSSDWLTEVPALGYDFTGASGNMYLLLIALPGEELHITEITLDFKPRTDPDEKIDGLWNIFGDAYNDYKSFDSYAGKMVTFEDVDDGTIFSTITATNGHWSLNLASGHYIFNVQDSEMLLDTATGPVTHIDYLYDGGPTGLRVDLDGNGNIIYMDEVLAWYGVDVPLPLITANGY